MLKAVSLTEFVQTFERRLRTLRVSLSSRLIEPLELHRELCGLEQICELVEQLRSHGFDEVYFVQEEEPTSYRDGWLPLSGSDFLKYLRALRAAGIHKSYIPRASYSYFPSPRVRVIEDEVYVRWPEGDYGIHPTAYIRLDDAILGDRFTSGIEFPAVGRELLERYPKRLRTLLKTACTLHVQDYLRIARRVCGYAVRLYEETGFPVQMLPPFFTAASPLYVLGADWVDFMLVNKIGYPFGNLRPYDPRFGIMLAKPTLPYDAPKLFELEGEDLLETLGAIAGAAILIHRGEDGSELYLYFEGHGAGLYEAALPPPEYVTTYFAAKALNLKGEFLKPRAEGLPGPLLSLFADKVV